MEDHQGSIMIDGELRSFKNSDCFSECLGFKNNFNSSLSCEPFPEKSGQKIFLEESLLSKGQDCGEQYYQILFSPEKTALSLMKRNQYLEMKSFEREEKKAGQLYQNRSRKVSNLKSKDNQQLNILMQLKEQQNSKYLALTYFMKLFATIKLELKTIRNDYYSAKTFHALRNTPEEKLYAATNIVNRMFKQIISFPPFTTQFDEQYDGRLIQFLIIPRFLISKEKVIKFVEDQDLQNNFKLLIYTGCLGHYNNEANKKFPTQIYMQKFRVLLKQKNGKERYKKICSINHGGKVATININKYFKLYQKGLESLKNIEGLLKKNKNSLTKVISQLDKYKDEKKKDLLSEQKISKFQAGSFPISISDCLGLKQQVNDNLSDFFNFSTKEKKDVVRLSKNENKVNLLKIRKSTSLPIQQKQMAKKQAKFKLKRGFRKALTLQMQLTIPICQENQEYDFQ